MAFQARFASMIPGEVLPKAVQDMATSSLTQAREAYSSLRNSAETFTTGIESSGQAAARGIQSFSTSVLDAVQANADATLGFLKAMAGVRTLSEAIELQVRHARLQFEAAQSQAKTLADIANKTVTETAKPVRKAIDAGLSRRA
jgi:phasin